jgi:predicted kinase
MNQVLIQMHGHPGSGKSALARALGRLLPAIVIDKDVIASALIREGGPQEAVGGLSYQVMYAQAARFLADGHSVIMDSPCFWPRIEESTRAVADAAAAQWVMIETRCSDELRDARLAGRARLESNPATRDLGPMRPGMYHPDCERLLLDSSHPVADLVADAVDYVASHAPHWGAATRIPAVVR